MSLILGAIGVGGKVLGGLGKRKAGKEMKRLGREQELMAQENAMLERRELSEGIRRQEATDQRTRGTALSRAAASGVKLSGSMQGSLDYLESEQSSQIDWMEEAGASKIDLNLQSNLLQAKSTKLSGDSMRKSGITDVLGAFGTAGSLGWFKK